MQKSIYDPKKLSEITAREVARFRAERPRSMELLNRGRRTMPDGVPMAWMSYFYPAGPIVVAQAEGAFLTDVDGHRYLDMNLADTSMATGYGTKSVAEAVDRQFRNGSQMLLPTQEAVEVTEELADRFGLPGWQFTLSASNANTEAMRIARAKTGRNKVLMFDGKYHGMLDESLHYLEEGQMVPESAGLPRRASEDTIIVQYNDLEAVDRALSAGDVACVLAEPAVTNVGGVLMPDEDFHAGLRQLTRQYDAILILDEAHTHVCAFGGLTRAWSLEPDILVLGKALGGGIPVGAYGLSEELKDFLEADPSSDFDSWHSRVALGGTLFGNSLQIAATKATLETVLTEENHARVNALGDSLADGIEAMLARLGLAWSAYRLFCRSGYHPAPTLPRNNLEMAAVHDTDLRNAIHVYLANRGVWEAIDSATPAVSFAMQPEDVEFYLSLLEECLAELCD
jgi:glutamate-1-semialdehyde 2,1-aminomutase